MLACYKMHLKRMFTRREYMFVVTVLLIMLTAAFVESCRNVFGWLETSLNSAALGWIMHTDQQPFGNTGMRIFVFFLFGILAAMVYGDAPCIDKKARALLPAVVRTKGKQYEISGALAAFTGAFVTFFAFFLLSQLLALIVFPIHRVACVPPVCLHLLTAPRQSVCIPSCSCATARCSPRAGGSPMLRSILICSTH